MSSTVEYKGSTLTTVDNTTRVLETAGTWLEDDITITDVSSTPTGTKTVNIITNGTITEDVTNYANVSITTAVPTTDTGTVNITSNGVHSVVGYADADVNVPNSYTASDEGKVVSNGALVSQASDTITANGTYDTTLINDLTVDVDGGIDISDYLDTDITGLTKVYENSGINLNGASIVNTGVLLFSSANINKDFKIIMTDVTADKSLNPSASGSDAIFSAKAAASPYPGFTCRPMASISTNNNNGNIWILDKVRYCGIVISRTNGTISVGVVALPVKQFAFSTAVQNAGSYFAISKNGNLATVTNVPFVLGGEVNTDNVTGRRFCGGTIGSILIAMEE